MKVIHHKFTDPYFNLALEEHLLRHCEDEFFVLWQNAPSIIVGRNQNTWAEINYDYVREHNIPVVRRGSGGGAVFHDLGNINYTFIQHGKDGSFNNYALFCRPIIEVLQSLGVDACLSGRNDMLIDGKKFSGNAQCAYKNRIMHHGTLMFSADVEDMTNALNVHPLKIQSKGIKSVRSRVTNISEHLPQRMDIEHFCALITGKVIAMGGETYELSEEDLAAAEQLKSEKYATIEWNYGFRKSFSISKQSAFPCGFFDVRINVESGKISEIKIFGDYFGEGQACEAERTLTGVPYTPEGLKSAIEKIDVPHFFAGLSPEQFFTMLI